MADHADPNEWLARLGAPGAALLSPGTSEATQKAGARLVLASVLTILVVNGMLVVKGGEPGGILVEASKFVYTVGIAGIACLYFLLLYAFDVFRDRKAAHYRSLPDWAEIQKLRDEHVVESDALVERQNEANRLLALRHAKYDELLGNFRNLPAVDPSASPEEFERQMEASRRWRDEQNRRFNEWLAYCASDGLEELSKEQMRMVLEGTQLARAEALLSLLRTSKFVERVRWVTDVLLPCGLGVVAVASAIWYLLAKWGF